MFRRSYFYLPNDVQLNRPKSDSLHQFASNNSLTLVQILYLFIKSDVEFSVTISIFSTLEPAPPNVEFLKHQATATMYDVSHNCHQMLF